MQTLRKSMTLFAMVAAAVVVASTVAQPALAQESKKPQLSASATDKVFLQEAHADVLFEILVDSLAKLTASDTVRDLAHSLALKGMELDSLHIRPTANAVGARLERRGESRISALARLAPYQVILINDLRRLKGQEFNTAALHALLFVNQVWMGQAMAVVRFGRVARVRAVAQAACDIAIANIAELQKLIPPVAP